MHHLDGLSGEGRLCCSCSKRKFSPIAVTSLCVIIFSFTLVAFVFIAPGWAWTREIRNTKTFQAEVYGHYGLWWICWNLVEWEQHGYGDCELMTDLGYVPSWFKGLQALSVFMLMTSFCALLLNVLYICMKRANENRRMIKGVIVFCLITAVLATPLFILFCVLFLHDTYWCCDGAPVEIVDRQLDYAFVIACCIGPFFCIAAFIAWKEKGRLQHIDEIEKYHIKVERQSVRKRKVQDANDNDGYNYKQADYDE